MKIKSPARDDVEIDMSPMIDLVFLLLIFFMVASVVARPDKVEVLLPASDAAKIPDDIKGRMMLSLDQSGDIYVGSTPVSIDELKACVTAELDDNPNLRILIRADERVEYGVCKELMIACGEVGATDLIYATFED